MIAYEELESALARWKARRSDGLAADGQASETSEHGIPTGIATEDEPASDSTGELDVVDEP